MQSSVHMYSVCMHVLHMHVVCVCMCVCVYVSIELCGYVVCIKLINAQILEVKVLRNSILVLKLFKH